jgi:hypothetical protein
MYMFICCWGLEIYDIQNRVPRVYLATCSKYGNLAIELGHSRTTPGPAVEAEIGTTGVTNTSLAVALRTCSGGTISPFSLT